MAAFPDHVDFEGRRRLLEQLGAPGGPLADDTASSTIHNSTWFEEGIQPSTQRKAVHRKIRNTFRAQRPNVKRERRAIVLAGPPGAGKSSARKKLIADMGSSDEDWRDLNADDFKDQLLLRAARDGSIDRELAPPGTEALTPRERASLVHEESSLLMKQERDRAILRGENIVLDGTLANEPKAFAMLEVLQKRGYAVDIIVVDGPKPVTKARAEYRWRSEHIESLKPDATATEQLGGRAVPPGFIDKLYEDDEQSICSGIAKRVAEANSNVISFQRYAVDKPEAAPELVEKYSGKRDDGRWSRKWALRRATPVPDTPDARTVHSPSTSRAANASFTEAGGDGHTWVQGHTRNGREVEGHYRKPPSPRR